MDSDDEMVALLLEDEQAFDDDLREHLLIIASLQDMVDAEAEKRKRSCHGGSRPGRRKSKPRQRMEGHVMLHNDYFADDATHADNFRRRYRMSKGLFMNILHGVREFDPYFKLNLDAVGVVGFLAIQKCTGAMRMLAYGAPVDTQDDYLRMSESTAVECMYKFCRAVVGKFGKYYWRGPTEEETARIMAQNAARISWNAWKHRLHALGMEELPVCLARTNIDPNNVPLASLVAQEEHVDVNFIKNNNFNNNAYRNNSSNNYRPYPYNNGNGYGNSYGNSYNNNRNSPPGLEAMLKEFISTQTAFNKSVEEKLGKIDILASKVDSLAADVDLLKSKVLPNENHHNKIVTTANAIQVRINENIRLMAELRARWDREENEKLAKEKNVAKVLTITTTSNANATHVAAPPTNNNKRIGVSNVSTSNAKREKLPETAETACDKAAEIFSNIGDDDPIALDYNGLNFDDCHISEVIKFLQKLAKSPNASAINLAFTHHITNALIKAREEKLEREASIPKKLEGGWEPIIKMKVKDFDCNALCDLGASISVMTKKIYDMLDLPPLKNCYLDVNLADHSTKKPLGKVDNVRITVNNNLVSVDFVVLDIECNASCPIILGRPFRTVGAIIDMKEGNIKYQFPLKKGMEHFLERE
ncbi:hypothetical protein QYE76_006078, partial [Lolium multiflorum]